MQGHCCRLRERRPTRSLCAQARCCSQARGETGAAEAAPSEDAQKVLWMQPVQRASTRSAQRGAQQPCGVCECAEEAKRARAEEQKRSSRSGGRACAGERESSEHGTEARDKRSTELEVRTMEARQAAASEAPRVAWTSTRREAPRHSGARQARGHGSAGPGCRAARRSRRASSNAAPRHQALAAAVARSLV
jgi:hypothetical protein